MNARQDTVLVVGGAGYIGSHTVRVMADLGRRVVVLDNLSTGHAQAVQKAPLVVGDAGDVRLVAQLVREHAVRWVIHFASFSQVGQSVADPALYYQNNVARTVDLLYALCHAGVRGFVFSSTAAIFGDPVTELIDEAHPKNPVNPYGRTKLLIEQMLGDLERAHGLRSVCLRYFNAAGAHPDGSLGEWHEPESHLIPLAIMAALGQRGPLQVYGSDYPTPDGTCIRDYVHVMDLALAHVQALDRLAEGGGSDAFNLGNGAGYSVRQVLDIVGALAGRPVPAEWTGRRPGDPPRLVADAARARDMLGWQPRYPDLRDIVAHAWRWHAGCGLGARASRPQK